MWGRLGPRFAVEAAFLILLAIGLGLADQSWVVIVAVMAAGWAVVSLIELVASRRATAQWTYRREEPAEQPALPTPPVQELPPPAVLPIDAPAAPSAPAPGPAPMPAEPVAPPEAAPETAGEETMEVPAPEPAEEERARRRWFRRRRTVEDGDELVPEPTKHVRRLDAEQVEEPSHAESAEHRS